MGRNVLIIDDNELTLELLRSYLEAEDLAVETTTNSHDGLGRALATPPDLILLDVQMPGLDGFEVCRRLKNEAQTRQVPVIFLTGEDDRRQKVAGLDLGAADYVTKPFDHAELLARVRAALRTKRLIDLLATRAQIDGLTGLWNRAYFDEHLESRIRFATRRNSGVGCLMIDLDRFKEINDTHGHPTGDRVIQHVGRCLLEVCRAEDIPCRFGGDEFAVIAHAENLADIQALAQRLHDEIGGRSLRINRMNWRPQATIGGAVLVPETLEDGVDPAAALVEAADRELYEAKAAGRHRFRCAVVRSKIGADRRRSESTPAN